MENPIKMDDLGGYPFFWKHPYIYIYMYVYIYMGSKNIRPTHDLFYRMLKPENDKHPAPMAEETNVKTAAPVDPSVSKELDHVKTGDPGILMRYGEGEVYTYIIIYTYIYIY